MLLSAALAVAVIALVFNVRATAQGGGGDASRDLIAVTGTYGSGASVLYVIDTRTQHLAVYKTDNGRKVELVAARDITWDLKLERYNDDSEYAPREMKKNWSELLRTGGATTRPVGETPAPR